LQKQEQEAGLPIEIFYHRHFGTKNWISKAYAPILIIGAIGGIVIGGVIHGWR
jgi:hypothetical protein